MSDSRTQPGEDDGSCQTCQTTSAVDMPWPSWSYVGIVNCNGNSFVDGGPGRCPLGLVVMKE
eukprot:3903531-Ditylum_brightwellii.AAC.1